MDKNRMQELAGVIVTEGRRENTLEGKILNTLSGADFEQWYENEFMDFIEGKTNAPGKEDILKEIKRMFGV
jgi:hypothetical protein